MQDKEKTEVNAKRIRDMFTVLGIRISGSLLQLQIQIISIEQRTSSRVIILLQFNAETSTRTTLAHDAYSKHREARKR